MNAETTHAAIGNSPRLAITQATPGQKPILLRCSHATPNLCRPTLPSRADYDCRNALTRLQLMAVLHSPMNKLSISLKSFVSSPKNLSN